MHSVFSTEQVAYAVLGSQFRQYSMAASPPILGTDLTTLNPTQNPVDYALLTNKQRSPGHS